MSPRTLRTANRALWTAQIPIALLFLFAGATKFMLPAERLQQGPITLPLAFLYFIGVCECLGAFALLLPGRVRLRTVLTPLAAAGLTIIMIGAAELTALSMGASAAIFPAVVGLITAFIALGRLRLDPIHRAL
jgi:hypothetical protein